MLYQNAGEATSPTSTKGGTNAKQVGLGAQLSSINKMMGQGNALSTGRSLDVCVDGEGYLMVAKGDAIGTVDVDATNGISGGTMQETLFTRDGNLTLDKDGNLLTSDGYRVMGYPVKLSTVTGTNSAATSIDPTGNVLFVNADAVNATTKKSDLVFVPATSGTGATLQPLKIPDSIKKDISSTTATVATTTTTQPIKKFEIGKDGLITAILGDGSRSAIGQIAMASFKNPEGLTSKGGNLSNVSSNSGPAIIKTGVGSLPANDNSGGFGDVVQGALEGSNVDLTEQFTDMITATRSFQAASKMITTGDEILQTVTGLMR